MSWINSLYETYEANLDRIGEISKNRFNQEYTLIPVSHTTQTAHIEVNVTENGEFHSAFVIERNDRNTIIPCTENAASRSGMGANKMPYPLHDKLSFVAGDFIEYAGKIRNEEPFTYYIKLLENWVSSPYNNNKLKSIYKYVQKKQLISDLVEEKILFLDTNGKLIEKWNKQYEEMHGDRPEIFSASAGGQYNAFVRFNVYSPNKILTDIWHDKEMYNSFIQFYNKSLDENDLCFVTGEHIPITDRHANKIRNAGDKAKLISGNDRSGFTFRGRFASSQEATSISYDVSQKAHNALKWLIDRQGRIIDGRVFLIWSNDTIDTMNATDDAFSLTALFAKDNEKTIDRKTFTNAEIARELSKAIDGYKHDLSTNAKVTILVLDAATTGRLAVLYYRSLDKEFYLERIKKWHATCMWRHRYHKNESGNNIEYYGAPATRDIAFATYGPRANEKLVKELIERMLPCILDDREIPQDIVKSAFYRASNPVGLERWEWEKTLSITCALLNRKERVDVGLDTGNDNRDYLFGRLLAIADVLERRALGAEENRATNAIRYMNSFSKHPERTWNTIQSNLQPYQVRLGKKGIYLASLIDEVASKIKYEDFNNKPLSGKYLLGFYSQRHELYQKKESNKEMN